MSRINSTTPAWKKPWEAEGDGPIIGWAEVPSADGDGESLYVVEYDREEEPIGLRFRLPGDVAVELTLSLGETALLADALRSVIYHVTVR